MTELAREYGEGLYVLAGEEKQEREWLEELKVIHQCFRENPDFVRLLGNLSLGKDERVAILDQALRGQVHDYVLNFLKLLCERGAIWEFEGCESAYRALYNHDHGVMEAVVTTTVALSAKEREQLLEKLRAMTGREIALTEKIDPAVMGGVVLEMNGKRYDNSVATRLETMRRIIGGQGD